MEAQGKGLRIDNQTAALINTAVEINRIAGTVVAWAFLHRNGVRGGIIFRVLSSGENVRALRGETGNAKIREQ